MGYKISDDKLKCANRCLFGHRCQEEGNSFKMCHIERSIQNRALLIKERAKDFCPYCSSFGYNDFCTCPVRIEIFKKYGN